MSVAYRGGDMRASKLALAAVCLLSTACLSHADDQPTVNTIDAQLSEIGDVTIIRDTDTLVLEGQKVIETVQKSSAKDRSEDFRLIRPIRAKLSKRSPELRALLEAFRQYKFSLKNQIQQKQAAIESKKTDTDTSALLESKNKQRRRLQRSRSWKRQNKNLVDQILLMTLERPLREKSANLSSRCVKVRQLNPSSKRTRRVSSKPPVWIKRR
jgi:predicted RNase H-like nuclease (RuvC/YqgF family)